MKRTLFLMVACIACVTWAAANGTVVTLTTVGGASAGGAYIYPYYLQVGGSTGPTLTVTCDDYSDEVQLGETWQATLNTFSDLQNAMFGTGGAHPTTGYVQDYEEVAWLIGQFGKPANSNQIGDIQYAIWDIFDPSAPNYSDQYGSAAAWISLAQSQNYNTSAMANYFSEFALYTPIAGTQPNGDGLPQEYVTMVNPEPPTYILGITGLVLFGFWQMHRRKLAQAAASRD